MAPDRQKLEAEWHNRCLEAKHKLDAATLHLHEIEREIRSGSAEEGSFQYRQAVRAETEALIEHSRVVRVYTELMKRGKLS